MNTTTSVNADEYPKLRNFFEGITADRDQHARFVNTLSFLEYVGARKILKSQPEAHINANLLAHVAEEVRHAQFFKKMALALSDGNLKDYAPSSLWNGMGAWRYFQGIDQTCAEVLKDTTPWKNYLLTTYAIESRALSAYSLYFEFVKDGGHRKLLSGIIQEEQTHLLETEIALKALGCGADSLREVGMTEPRLFWAWINSSG